MSTEAVVNPVTGEWVSFLRTSEDTNGELLQFDVVLEPNAVIVSDHLHPGQEERITIEDGVATIKVDGEEFELLQGAPFSIPVGSLHRWWNQGDRSVVARVDFRPALNTQNLIERGFELARAAHAGKRSEANLLSISLLLLDHKAEVRFPELEYRSEYPLVSDLAYIGQMFGY